MKVIQKRMLMHTAIFMGVILLLFTFFLGWEIFYPNVGGILFTFTRMMIYSLYTVLIIIMLNIYGACQFGKTNIGNLVYSQILSEIISIGLIYVVAVANNRRFFNIFPMILILIVQVGIDIIWSYLCSKVYFRVYPAKKVAMIYCKEDDVEKFNEVDFFAKKFHIDKFIKNPTSINEIRDELKDLEVVFVAGVNTELRAKIAEYCMDRNIIAYIYPEIGDIVMQSAKHMQMFNVPIVRVRRSQPNPEYLFLKRLFDILISIFGIIVSSIFMLITAIAIKVYDGGPVLYKQVRLTKDGREFKILKFRSMKVDAEKDSGARLASDNDDRITPVGHIIRACRADELPQLFNILVGDMSVVGPRPERPELIKEYLKELPEFNLRLQCKAGLTGYAQVYGRYNTEPKDKLKMDLMYIQNMSLLSDLILCFYTVKILFMKESTQGIKEECAEKEKG